MEVLVLPPIAGVGVERAGSAPVTPIGFVVPHYRHNTHGAVPVELGTIAYDLLSADESLPWHRPLGRRATLALDVVFAAG